MRLSIRRAIPSKMHPNPDVVTLIRLTELRKALLESRQPDPPLNASEYLSLVICTERWLRWAAEVGEAWESVKANEQR